MDILSTPVYLRLNSLYHTAAPPSSACGGGGDVVGWEKHKRSGVVEGNEMGNWNTIETQEDIDRLMTAYNDFHDSCVVSLNFQSGAFVGDDDWAMHFGNAEDRILSVVFQSQWKPKTIELQFSGLRQIHLIGWQDNYWCDISSAYLAFHNGLLPGSPRRVIVWSDTDWFDVKKIDNSIHEPADTYIVANALRWRVVISDHRAAPKDNTRQNPGTALAVPGFLQLYSTKKKTARKWKREPARIRRWKSS